MPVGLARRARRRWRAARLASRSAASSRFRRPASCSIRAIDLPAASWSRTGRPATASAMIAADSAARKNLVWNVCAGSNPASCGYECGFDQLVAELLHGDERVGRARAASRAGAGRARRRCACRRCSGSPTRRSAARRATARGRDAAAGTASSRNSFAVSVTSRPSTTTRCRSVSSDDRTIGQRRWPGAGRSRARRSSARTRATSSFGLNGFAR